MDKKQFKDLLKHTISAKILNAIAQKEDGKKYLSYAEAKKITHDIEGVFMGSIGRCPAQIDAACSLANAILAPSQAERERLIKHAKTLTTGFAGIALILVSLASALGWGLGVQALIVTFFAGSPVLGPIGLAVAGVSLACVAGYFFISNNEEEKTERYEKALCGGVLKAVDMSWDEYEEKLSQIKVEGIN